MTIRARWLWLAILLPVSAAAQAPSQLGPKDGAGLRPDDVNRVAIGRPAPNFTLEAADGHPVTLSALRGRFVVLVFYRGHW
jgi:cytochrome oxidase Cu insertion factor (SCO1/SenC/PrrC family)